jgi:hypothetical protein
VARYENGDSTDPGQRGLSHDGFHQLSRVGFVTVIGERHVSKND